MTVRIAGSSTDSLVVNAAREEPVACLGASKVESAEAIRRLWPDFFEGICEEILH